MARPSSPHPADSELEVLAVLWQKGPCTLREIHESLRSKRNIGLTTTLKKVQIMTSKGLVLCDDSARPNRYTAAKTQARTRASLLKDLVRKAFGGSAGGLLMQAVQDGIIGEHDLNQAQDEIQKARRGKGAAGP